MYKSRHTYEWVMSRTKTCITTAERRHGTYLCIWMIHITHMYKSRHTYEWVMSHTYTWITKAECWHGTLDWHFHCTCIYEWVTSHIWMSHATHMNESCHTYEWVTSHIWIGHDTYVNERFNMWMRHSSCICRRCWAVGIFLCRTEFSDWQKKKIQLCAHTCRDTH